MTGKLFDEYLNWFRQEVHNKRCVLLIDGFSAHELGLEIRQAKEKGPMQNIKVVFLPANTTSVCQPLDQGIIASWKCHYRRRWLRFAVTEFDAVPERDPYETMDILKAVMWGIEAWELDVSEATIENCWLKSQVLASNYRPQTKRQWDHEQGRKVIQIPEFEQTLDEARLEMIQNIEKLNTNPRISQALNMKFYDNPVAERVVDSDGDIFAEILTQWQPEQPEPELMVAVQKVSLSEALAGLQAYTMWELQQDKADAEWLKALEVARRKMDAIKQRGAKQVGIENWLVRE